MMRTRIKICGMRRKEDIDSAIEAGADAIGLIFYKSSKRYICADQASLLVKGIPPFIHIVGVFVNASLTEIKDVCKKVPLTLLQFHGDESNDCCQFFSNEVNLPWIKAVRVAKSSNENVITSLANMYSKAQAILFDSDSSSFGGTGESFNWESLPNNPMYPIILAGGLHIDNVASAINSIHPYGIDVCSSVEIDNTPGVKDPIKITQLVEMVRLTDANRRKHLEL